MDVLNRNLEAVEGARLHSTHASYEDTGGHVECTHTSQGWKSTARLAMGESKGRLGRGG